MRDNEEKVEILKIADLFKNVDDDGTFETSLYELFTLIEITKGVNGINYGNGISLKQLHKEMEELYESTSREIYKTKAY